MQSFDAKSLRILVIADSKVAVPPAGYGGAERILGYLCEGFARRGHRVTLMAGKDSTNYGRLITYPWAGRGALPWRGYCRLNFLARSMRELAFGHDAVVAGCRIDYLTPFLRAGVPLLYRFGNPIYSAQVLELIRSSRGPLSLISVSDQQRAGMAGGIWHTIHNSVDIERFAFSPRATGGYLAFLGRLTANKGPDKAIRAARKAGLALKIAGNVSEEEGGREFFEREVAPHLGDDVEWIGEIDDTRKCAFLAGARALLAPIQWDEPCANVVPEALACGTPVIATARGSMPELIRDGVNGFLASSVEEIVQAVKRIEDISRHACRRDAEERFGTERMVDRYLAVIHGLVAARSTHSRAIPHPQDFEGYVR